MKEKKNLIFSLRNAQQFFLFVEIAESKTLHFF